MKAGRPPLILTGPYEHHSNILPWRESGAKVLSVRESLDGGVDLLHLEELLKKHSSTTLKIGTFSAASNVTGIISDTDGIAIMLHKHKALAFFDYAAGGPYLDINMNPLPHGHDGWLAYKDAVFISPHKFVGGVSTPGVLVFKTDLDRRFGTGRPALHPGGGTVLYVTEHRHMYTDKLEEREEGGTPDIVGAMRCGLAFRLKEEVGPPTIMALEHEHRTRLQAALLSHPNIQLLGNPDCPRLAIMSILVRHGKQYLHHGFVGKLLNDLFGIQARAGCACAGPYSMRLLGVDSTLGAAYFAAVAQGDAVVKTGFVRLNANFFVSPAAVGFLADAVRFVAEHGWKFLPLYANVAGTDEWQHRSMASGSGGEGSRVGLSQFSFEERRAEEALEPRHTPPSLPFGLYPPWETVPSIIPPLPTDRAGARDKDSESRVVWESYLAAAHAAAEGSAAASLADPGLQGRLEAEESVLVRSPQGRRLGWFLRPSQAVALLRSGSPAPAPAPATYAALACGLTQSEIEDLAGIETPVANPGCRFWAPSRPRKQAAALPSWSESISAPTSAVTVATRA
jgi:selenocysteine lyase/cysteine desulfurase